MGISEEPQVHRVPFERGERTDHAPCASVPASVVRCVHWPNRIGCRIRSQNRNLLSAPKGTPGPVLDRLTDALDQALDDETTRKRLFDLGADVPPKARRGQQQLVALVKSEMARWAVRY